MRYNFSQLSTGHSVDFLQEGDEYYNHYIELIDSARRYVHLQTYIFAMDGFGTRVHAALMRAAQRNVKVYVLIDSIGSQAFSEADEDRLKKAHVYIQRFNGITFKGLFYWGRRLHHKILIVDDHWAIVGGINVTDSGYVTGNAYHQLDFAVGLQGSVVRELNDYCKSIFKRSYRKNLNMHIGKLELPEIKPSPVKLKIAINDWVYRRWQITKTYSYLVQRAQKEITIVNAYFFPRRKFKKDLVEAARRGVRVRLILPRLSDWPSYILASQYLYGYFLKHDIEIYQWDKSILHGKMATVYGRYATIGSFNLNYTSYQQNLEINVDILSTEVVHQWDERLNELIKEGCTRITAENFLKPAPWRIRFLRFFFYKVLSVVANLSMNLTYQEEEQNKNKFYTLIRMTAALFFLILGILGALLPVMPGTPFFIISFFLVYRQILFSRKIKTH